MGCIMLLLLNSEIMQLAKFVMQKPCPFLYSTELNHTNFPTVKTSRAS